MKSKFLFTTLLTLILFSCRPQAGEDAETSRYGDNMQSSTSVAYTMNMQPREQGRIGSCHSFASINLIESAIYRVHKRKEVLSPAHLFSHHIFDDISRVDFITDEEIRNHDYRLRNGINSETPNIFIERGWVSKDLEAAKKYGVGLDRTIRYNFFANEFQKYKNEILSSVWLEYYLTGMHEAIRSFIEKKAPLTQSDYIYAIHSNSRAIKQKLFGGEEVLLQLEKEAKDIGRMISYFEVGRKMFQGGWYWDRNLRRWQSPSISQVGNNPTLCKEAGKEQLAFIKEQIYKYRRPVAIGMDIGALPEWHTKSGTEALYNLDHAIVAYDIVQNGTTEIIKIKNSWGVNGNFDIPDYRTCRIVEAIIFKTPMDGNVGN